MGWNCEPKTLVLKKCNIFVFFELNAYPKLEILKLKHRYRNILLIALAIVLIVSGCSRKKAGFTNRLYHDTTSHYNWYFNAEELMKQTEENLWLSADNDYLEVLPVYVLPDEEAQKNLYPSMDKIIEKCSTVIDRHSMEIKKKEYNKWIDDNFLMIGIANFYKGKYSTAQEMFTYVAKKYKGQESRFDAALWLSRTYIEQKRYNKATTVLSIIEKDNGKDRPKDFQANLETVYTDMFIRQARYKDALPHLEDAANLTTDKRMKARLTFILAQVYKELNRSKEAIDTYAAVIKLKPEYEMEFYAKISQALAYDRRLDPQKIKDMLWAMAKDEKNIEYYDQIYYALAEVELEQQHVEEGIALLKKSAKVSTNNPKQKGKSFLRLAQIYFTDREYVLSKNYYDSTATYLPEDYPNYETIVATGASLEGLVNDLEIINHNDSILALASLDEKDKEKKLLHMIADLEAQEEEKKQADLEALQRIQNQSGISSTKSSSGGGKEWYFYNTATLSSGFQEFRRNWGARKLEDNWRRSIRTEFANANGNLGVDSDSLLQNLGQQESKVKSLDEYLAELPQSDSAFASLNNEIIAALYDMGTIYKEQLKDDDNAIESFVRITNDYDTSATALQAYYQLYRIYLEKEQSGDFVGTGYKDNSEYYKSIILSDYPDSEFAKLINDPGYITSKSAKYEAEKTAYEATYKQYNRRQYSDVLIACNTVIQDEPKNNFLAKYYLVKALTVGARHQADVYENILREIVTKFNGTPEAEKAAELLGELNKVKAAIAREQAKNNSTDDNAATTQPDPDVAGSDTDVNTSMYNFDEGSEHFFALVFPKTDGDAQTLKGSVSNFDTQSFSSAGLRITNSFIDKDHQIIIVRSFDSKTAAMDYYNAFLVNKDVLKDINEKASYQKFVISTKNFTVLFRNKNTAAYQAFFSEKYLK